VPEPRTHYQLSFTSRQAVLLFVVVLAALTGAYFLGLMTGLAGRQPAGGTAVSASAAVPTAPAAAEKVSPSVTAPPSAQEQTPPPAVAAREPGKTEGLQFFEDRPAEPTPAALAPAKAAGGFWVQTLSTKSEREAKSRRAVLSRHGYRAIVESARGAGGPILYRVRVGPFASREEASKAAQTLERKEKAKTWIVPPGE
jgi:cell division protein FtsN